MASSRSAERRAILCWYVHCQEFYAHPDYGPTIPQVDCHSCGVHVELIQGVARTHALTLNGLRPHKNRTNHNNLGQHERLCEALKVQSSTWPCPVSPAAHTSSTYGGQTCWSRHSSHRPKGNAVGERSVLLSRKSAARKSWCAPLEVPLGIKQTLSNPLSHDQHRNFKQNRVVCVMSSLSSTSSVDICGSQAAACIIWEFRSQARGEYPDKMELLETIGEYQEAP